MTTQRIWRIGLTGGIGSGKSTVAGFWAQKGAFVMDADAISRSLTAPGGRAIEAIARTWGAAAIGPDGAMDRQAMRERIFQDPQAKRALEHIIHPLVGQLTAEQAQSALDQGKRCLVFDVPLLVESGKRWRRQVDRVLVVDCDEATQRQRVMQRSGLAAEEVDRIIAQQATRQQRLACADMVIFNQSINFDELQALSDQLTANFGL
jgi:dephospho-CoA kinase